MMTYTKENIQEGIVAKIDTLNCSERYKRLLKMRISRYPQEIEKNVLEWVNGEPLTDVNCHGESIVRTMQSWNFSEEDIAKLICGFVDYQDSQWRIPNHIWQAVTGLERVYDNKVSN